MKYVQYDDSGTICSIMIRCPEVPLTANQIMVSDDIEVDANLQKVDLNTLQIVDI